MRLGYRTCFHTLYDEKKKIYIYIIEHNGDFLSTYFLVNPFELPYQFHDIRWELVDKPSIISYFPSTFCPTLGHYQGRIYYKSHVTFVCTLQLCKNERLYCCIEYRLLFECVSINSVSSQRHLNTLAQVSTLIRKCLGCMFLVCSASRICRFWLAIFCFNIFVFSVRIFRYSVAGHECIF